MKKLLLAGASLTMFLNIVGSALAADMPRLVAPGLVFSWTSCFLGAHAGDRSYHRRGELNRRADWVRLPVRFLPLGARCRGRDVVTALRIEFCTSATGSVNSFCAQPLSGMNLRGNTNFGLPLVGASDIATITAKTDFLPSVTARLGYALGNWLLYVRAGGAWAGDKYSVTGTFLPTATAFGLEGVDNRPDSSRPRLATSRRRRAPSRPRSEPPP
jgi:outer membrane immunogenic protein